MTRYLICSFSLFSVDRGGWSSPVLVREMKSQEYDFLHRQLNAILLHIFFRLLIYSNQKNKLREEHLNYELPNNYASFFFLLKLMNAFCIFSLIFVNHHFLSISFPFNVSNLILYSRQTIMRKYFPA